MLAADLPPNGIAAAAARINSAGAGDLAVLGAEAQAVFLFEGLKGTWRYYPVLEIGIGSCGNFRKYQFDIRGEKEIFD